MHFGIPVAIRRRAPLRGPHPMGMVSLRTFKRMGDSHCLDRHLHNKEGAFRTDAQRLELDPRIPASGGFASEVAAQRSVNAAVTVNEARIAAWSPAADRFHPFIAEVGLGWINGTNLSREQLDAGERTSVPTSGVRIVLMPNARYRCGFAVLTAYNVSVPRPDPHPLPVTGDGVFDPAGLGRGSSGLPEAVAAEHRIAAGEHVTACWESRARARHAVACGVAYWSSEIRDWLADPLAPAHITRAFCAAETVGRTLHAEEWDAGIRTMTHTPVVIFTLVKDTSGAGGFVVARAFPARGF